MNWISLLGAIGVGAIVTKLLDVLWLNRVVRDNERAKWLREQRLVVFSKLAQELLSMGLWNGSTKPVEALSLAAQAILIANDDLLAKRIESFFSSTLEAKETLEKMQREASTIHRQIKFDTDDQQIEKIKAEAQAIIDRRQEKMKAKYVRIHQDARALVQELRAALLSEWHEGVGLGLTIPYPWPNHPVERTAHSAGFVVVLGLGGCGPPLTGSVVHKNREIQWRT